MSLLSEMLADSPGGLWMTDTLNDSSGNSNTLTLTGAPPTAQTVIPTVATASRSFDGVSVYGMNAADHASLDLGDVFTLEAWINVPTLPGAAAVRTILTKDTNGYQMGLRNSGLLFGSKHGVGRFAQTKFLLSTNTLYHCVITKSGATSFVYVNGNDATEPVAAQTCADNALSLRIGWNGSGGELIDGKMQYVAVYPTALSQARVLAHYNAGITLLSDTPSPPAGRGATW